MKVKSRIENIKRKLRRDSLTVVFFGGEYSVDGETITIKKAQLLADTVNRLSLLVFNDREETVSIKGAKTIYFDKQDRHL